MGHSEGLSQLLEGLRVVASILLILGSAFFVAAEYALVGSRRGRVEAMGKRGKKNAKGLAKALEDISPYVAATQIGITMLGIAIGAFTEPYVSGVLSGWLHMLNATAVRAMSYLIVVFVLLVVGELCPKYLALRHADRVALFMYRPLLVIVAVLKPFIWLAQSTAGLLLRPFKVDIHKGNKDVIPKEELVMLVQIGGASGIIDKLQADMVSRALRLDVLDAKDIMIHRLDIKWLDSSITKPELLDRLKTIPYSRMPVCRGDIDELVGVAYLHDIVKHLEDEEFSLENLVRPVVAVPENLTMSKILEMMRVEKTQMLIVSDEYGGTSGLVTLEDVVEEVFGELEDRLESERKPIEEHPNGRISARATVRIDELVSQLKLEVDIGEDTDTLATIVVNALGRVPRTGDSVMTNLGMMRVENMARRRITRVSLQLAPEFWRVKEPQD
jgi:CBS domain containing-hemolysin-like protein